MFAQYSKLVLILAMTTSFTMMGCQKKGTAGVKAKVGNTQPSQPDGKPIGPGPITPDEENFPPMPKETDAEKKAREAKEEADKKAKEGDKKDDNKTDADKKAELEKKAKEEAEAKAKADAEAKAKADADKKAKEDAGKKDEDKKVEVKSCSKDVVTSANTIQSANKALESLTAAEKTKQLSSIISLCNEWAGLFVKEKISSCTLKAGEKSYTATANSWNSVCFATGDALKAIEKKDNKYSLKADEANVAALKTLKAQTLVISEEAKELLSENNQDWKMYLVDGKIQSNEKDLSDLYKAKKVACSITTMGKVEYSQDSLIILAIKKVVPLVPRDDQHELQSGIDMDIELAVGSKSDKEADVTLSTGTLSCVNIKAARLNLNAISTALGQHISVQTK